MSVDSGPADAAEQAVAQWLTLPEVGEVLGIDVLKVRGLLRDRQLLARRRGERSVLQVPADFLAGGVIIKGLPGTMSVLRDNGFDDDEAMRWLFTADDTLPGTPVAALRENRGTEVRRRAQALAF